MAMAKKPKRYWDCSTEFSADKQNPCRYGREQKLHYHCDICKRYTALKPNGITKHVKREHGETHALPTSSKTADMEHININERNSIANQIKSKHGKTHALPTSSKTVEIKQINFNEKVTGNQGENRTFKETKSASSQPGEPNNNESEENNNLRCYEQLPGNKVDVVNDGGVKCNVRDDHDEPRGLFDIATVRF
ncbi:uncharacterized protein LOC111330069 [Stylophora pistillata]|nr:uncharacterized protein LOC111330069 [Stylophora pistillata]